MCTFFITYVNTSTTSLKDFMDEFHIFSRKFTIRDEIIVTSQPSSKNYILNNIRDHEINVISIFMLVKNT